VQLGSTLTGGGFGDVFGLRRDRTGVVAAQALVPPAQEMVDEDTEHNGNTTAMPALSSGLWCSHGKELARTPMPIE